MDPFGTLLLGFQVGSSMEVGNPFQALTPLIFRRFSGMSKTKTVSYNMKNALDLMFG